MYQQIRRPAGVCHDTGRRAPDESLLHFARRCHWMALQVERGDTRDQRCRVRIAVRRESRRIAGVARPLDPDAWRKQREVRTVPALHGGVYLRCRRDLDGLLDSLRSVAIEIADSAGRQDVYTKPA